MKNNIGLLIIFIGLSPTLICGINVHFKKPTFKTDYDCIQEEIEKYKPKIAAFLQQINSAQDLYEPLPIPSRMSPFEQIPAIFDLIRKKRNADLLEIIIAKKIPLTVLTPNGRSIFHELAAIGKSKVISLVLDLYKKYNLPCAQLIEAQNKQLWTPLMVAASSGHTACVKLLINQGARIYCLNKEYESALHLAVSKYHIRGKSKTNKVVRLLCTSGIEISIENENKCTARSIASLNSLYGAANIIDQYMYLYPCKELRKREAQTYFAPLPEEIVLSILLQADKAPPFPEKKESAAKPGIVQLEPGTQQTYFPLGLFHYLHGKVHRADTNKQK